MWQETKECTGDEAYNHLKWLEAAITQLRELPEQAARAWWDAQEKPCWLEIAPEEDEPLESVAERLEQEQYEWAETATVRYAEEKAEDEQARKRLLRTLEGSMNWKRYRLQHVRLCQQIPEPERVVKGSELAGHCGFLYLMKKLVAVRKPYSLCYEETPNSPHKIGATLRPFKKRRNELWRDKRLLPKAKYATVVPFELESVLHLHFDEFRVKRGEERQRGQRKNKAGEYFRLTPADVETFKETAANAEKWVLLTVEAELELQIMRATAILARAQQRV